MQNNVKNTSSYKKIFVLIMLLFVVPVFTLAQNNDSSVDILWEASSYTPPFYEGKGLKVGPQNIKFVAIVSIPTIQNIDSLYYKWSLNGRVLGTFSGVGKHTVHIPILSRNERMTLEVYDSSKQTQYAQTSTTITSHDPQILLYRSDPLLGVLYNKTVDSSHATFVGKEETFIAIPYYFTASSPNSSHLEYTWKINKTVGQSGAGLSSIILRKDGEGGKSIIDLEIKNTKSVFQNAHGSFILNL